MSSVCSKAVKEGQINLPSWANSHLGSEIHFMLFHGSEYTKVPLEPFGVVVLNEIFNHDNQTGFVSKAYSVISFSLQDTPESFHWTVVNAFGNPGHTLGHAGFSQHMVECSVRILETSVAVAQWMRVRVCGNCCPECVKHQRIVIGISDHIADNSSVIQIQNGTEIYLLYLNANVVLEFSNISQPFLVRPVRFKFPVQQIVCQIIRISTLPGTAVVAVLNRGLNPAAPADPKHPLVIHMGVVVPIQFILESAVSHLRMLLVNILNQISNALILNGPGGQFACCPPVISCPGNLQYPTGLLYRIFVLFMTLFDRKVQMGLPYLR